MTLGELADKLQALKEQKDRVVRAAEALSYGGNTATMQHKEQLLGIEQANYEILRAEELEL